MALQPAHGGLKSLDGATSSEQREQKGRQHEHNNTDHDNANN